MLPVWKIRELTDKVTNVVMNYSEVETKVREATNDDAWGPHGQIMSEISNYTYTYEHFPEVMGMLWKRMLHDNKKNWRRVYKSLLLLQYLIRNGSEKVVTSSREHIYDLRSLESFTFVDEHGKDQGINVRQKAKDIVDFIQDDDRLREERKKAKKNKDKYIGMSGEQSTFRNSYSDRFDEEPRHYGSSGVSGYGSSHMSNIDDWDSGRKSVAEEVIGKAKDLWNRARGFAEADVSAADEDFEEDFTSDSHRENSHRVSRFREFRDDDGIGDRYPDRRSDRFSSTSYKSNKNSDDKDADENDVDESFKSMSQSRATNNKPAKQTDLLFDIESKNNSSAVNGTNANGEFADFSDFQAANTAAPGPPSNPQSPTTKDEFSNFGSAPAQQPSANVSNADLLTGLSSMPTNNTPGQTGMPFQGVPANVIGVQNTVPPALQVSALDQTPLAPTSTPVLLPSEVDQKANNNNSTQKPTLWSNSSNLDINLDDLSISSQYKKTPAPSINQLQNQIIGKNTSGPTSPPYAQQIPMNQPMYPGGVGGGVMYNSGMNQMPVSMGPQTGVMGMTGVGVVAPMTAAQQPVNAQLKSRADKAFSSFGNFNK